MRRSTRPWAVLLALALPAGCDRGGAPSPPTAAAALAVEADAGQVRRLCSACHAFPPPDTFPRSAWREEVVRAYAFIEQRSDREPEWGRDYKAPPVGSVIAFFENRAPRELPPLPPNPAAGPCPVHLRRHDLAAPAPAEDAAVSNVNLAHLTDAKKLDLLVCDMRSGKVLTLKPYEPAPAWRELALLENPAHAEVVDLDGDGIKDLVVADLGSLNPTDAKKGRVVWLRGRPDGSFTPVTLLKGVGRVADVQAADFNGDGKLDLIVAVFGWQNTGEIIYLENRTSDWSRPEFVPHVVDDRHGAIHVPVADLNGDGRPDFVALISQEHETVVAFLNEGGGRFRKETIYAAPHPGWGSTGIQLVDLDGDGKLDVLLSNGDVLDPPYLLKPYHGVHWLRNRGTFPFEPHQLTAMYGAHRAVAADFRGTGRLDVVAVSFLPPEWFPRRKERQLDSIVLLEQTEPGRFVRHALEVGDCDHVTCAAGSWDGGGRAHLVTGHMYLAGSPPLPRAITLWKNEGPAPSAP
jgi:hypothetical protein